MQEIFKGIPGITVTSGMSVTAQVKTVYVEVTDAANVGPIIGGIVGGLIVVGGIVFFLKKKKAGPFKGSRVKTVVPA